MVSRASLVLALALVGCRGSASEQPMAGDLELCCKAAIDDVSFVGCRATGVCRTSESVWIRGPLTCSADTADQCEGGRCCTLDLDALATRGSVVPSIKPVADDEVEPSPTPVPDPSTIAPVPLDWQPLPKLVSIPNLVCPATAQRGVTGTVVMQVEVDASGRVTAVVIRQGFEPECDELARDALLHAEFEPAVDLDGEPIASSLRYEYGFELSDISEQER